MTPLLSVVIPTHNRHKYAIYAIQSLMAIDDHRLEIIICDTSTDGGLACYFAQNAVALSGDMRLKYHRPASLLDMTGNHNAAISLATGTYVCLIGDDDTITVDALAAAEWANNNGIDAIAPSVVANFAWPDFRSRILGAKHAGRLYYSGRINKVKWVDSKMALFSAMKSGAQGTEGLPKVYHGIVRRSLLEKIKQVSGSYFHGSSPDVSGAIGLCLLCQKFIVVDYPLTIPGASGGSNTGRSAMNKHKGRMSQEGQTSAFLINGWSPGIPKFFSVETVWAHAAVETIRKISPKRLGKYNYAKIIAICQVLHGEYREEIQLAVSEIIHELNKDRSQFMRDVSREKAKYIFSRIYLLAKRISSPTAAGGRHFISGLENIADSATALPKLTGKLSWEESFPPQEKTIFI